MDVKNWRYYNHALIPTTPPYQNVDLRLIKNEQIWKYKWGGEPLLVRWTTDFDCGYETEWWYIVKDKKFDIDTLKSKRRYEINKGVKNFDVRVIDPCAYKKELYSIQVAAFSAYPKKYRPIVDEDSFLNEIDTWAKFNVFGAFYRETNKLVGYAFLSKDEENWVDFYVLKAIPEYERYALNAAIVEKVMSYYEEFLANGGIICDGARNINHETKFQDYLEKYFGFRKAYCNLHIRYNPKIKWLFRTLIHLERVLQKFDKVRIIHLINGVIKMDKICHKKYRK